MKNRNFFVIIFTCCFLLSQALLSVSVSAQHAIDRQLFASNVIENFDYPNVKIIDKNDVQKTEESPFTDINNNDNRFEAITFLKNKNIIEGYADGEIKLSRNLNRAEFVKILLEARAQIDNTFEVAYDNTHTFSDNSSRQWYGKYVSTAKKYGIVEGYNDGTFRPAQTISFTEAYKVIVETLGIEITEEEIPKDLVKYENEWFFPYIHTVYEKNLSSDLMVQIQKNTLGSSITRGAAFETLYNSYKLDAPSVSDSLVGGIEYPTDSSMLQLPFRQPFYMPITKDVPLEKLTGTLYKVDINEFIGELDEVGMNLQIESLMASENFKEGLSSPVYFETEVKVLDENIVAEKTENLISLPVSEQGLYLLRINNSEGTSDVFLNVSNLVLFEMNGAQKSQLWAVNSVSEKAVEDTEITLFGSEFEDEKIVLKTDEFGLVAYDYEANMVMGKYKDDVAFLLPGYKLFSQHIPHNRFASSEVLNFDSVNTSLIVSEADIKAYAYPHRKVYYPGGNVFINGLIKQVVNGTYSAPNFETVEVVVRSNENNSEIFRKSVTLSDYSSLSANFVLDNNVVSGKYNIYIDTGSSQNFAGDFEVQNIPNPDYFIDIITQKDHFTRGENVLLTLQGKSKNGSILKNADITYEVYERKFIEPVVNGLDEVAQHVVQREYNGEFSLYTTGNTTLNDKGESVVSLKAGEKHDLQDFQKFQREDGTTFLYKESESVEFLIEVKEVNGEPQEQGAFKRLYAHKMPFNTAIFGNQIGSVGKTMTLNVQSIAHNGKVFPGASTLFSIKRKKYVPQACTHRFNYFTSQVEKVDCVKEVYEEIEQSEKRAGNSGKIEINFKPEISGEYMVDMVSYDLVDKNLGTQAQKRSFSFFVEGVLDSFDSSSLHIYTNAQNFRSGQSLQLSAPMLNKEGEALLVVSQNDVLDAKVVPYGNYIFSDTLRILRSYGPSVDVSLHYLHDGKLISVAKMIPVYPEENLLRVTITPNKFQYTPGARELFRVKVEKSDRSSAQAELTFILLDKKMVDQIPETLIDIFKEYYRPLHYIIQKRSTGIVDSIASEDVLRFESEVENSTKLLYQRDELFKNFGVVISGITTNVNGEATIEVPLPNITNSWIAQVIAVSRDSKVGDGIFEFTAKKPIELKHYFPETVTAGETIDLRTELYNNTVPGIQRFELRGEQFCTADSGNACSQKSIGGLQKVLVAQGKSEFITWRYEVPKDLEDGAVVRLVFVAEEVSNGGTEEKTTLEFFMKIQKSEE